MLTNKTSSNARDLPAASIGTACLWSALLLLFTLLLSGCTPAAEIEPAELFEVAVFSTQPASGAEFDIYILNDADDSPKRLTTDPGTDWLPRLSPNGERILYISSRSGRAEVWVMNADGSSQKRLTELGGTSLAEYSPDGSTIAFTAARDRGNELYLMDDDGANVRTLAPIERSVHSFAWSPDGSQIVFSAREGGDLSSDCCDIFVANADGTGETRLTQTPYFEWWPQWSPDGAQIVFMSEWEDNTDIVLMNVDGTGRRNLTDHAADDLYPLWTADGEHILFFSSRPRSLRDLFNSEGAHHIINRDGSGLERLDGLDGRAIEDLCCYQ